MMLILGQVRLSKRQESLVGLVPRRVRAPQGQSPPQGLEKIFHPVGSILRGFNSNGTIFFICQTPLKVCKFCRSRDHHTHACSSCTCPNIMNNWQDSHNSSSLVVSRIYLVELLITPPSLIFDKKVVNKGWGFYFLMLILGLVRLSNRQICP